MIDPILFPKLIQGLRRNGSRPVQDPPARERMQAALTWIERAYAAAGKTGISKGYDLLRSRWSPPYPETTGYTIPTLLNTAQVLDRPDLARLAFSLADYLLTCAAVAAPGSAAGVAHWQPDRFTEPVVFDTGQVIFGWLAAYDASRKSRYLEAASQAGRWLVSIQDTSGSWKKNQHLGVEKVIDTRVAWALLLLHRQTGDEIFRQAARGNLEWAAGQQDADGWFHRCAFQAGDDPITHTLAYTAEGLFESGCLLGDDHLIQAGCKTAAALLDLQRPDGSLASTYGPGWKPSHSSSCLTGNCQMSRLWLLIYKMNGDPQRSDRYAAAARKSIEFVQATQDLATSHPGVYGAIAGSFPIYGIYERLKYPNWATKFFLDALLAFEKADHDDRYHYFPG